MSNTLHFPLANKRLHTLQILSLFICNCKYQLLIYFIYLICQPQISFSPTFYCEWNYLLHYSTNANSFQSQISFSSTFYYEWNYSLHYSTNANSFRVRSFITYLLLCFRFVNIDISHLHHSLWLSIWRSTSRWMSCKYFIYIFSCQHDICFSFMPLLTGLPAGAWLAAWVWCERLTFLLLSQLYSTSI